MRQTTEYRTEIIVRIELPPALAALVAAFVGSVSGEAPALATPGAHGDQRPRRRGRPSNAERAARLAAQLPAAHVPIEPTHDDVRAAFAELCSLDGGEVRAAQVLARFRLAHVGDAPPDVLGELIATLKSAMRA
jgi:hypothetical protein